MTYASWIPEGSSLTIESDEGISPASIVSGLNLYAGYITDQLAGSGFYSLDSSLVSRLSVFGGSSIVPSFNFAPSFPSSAQAVVPIIFNNSSPFYMYGSCVAHFVPSYIEDAMRGVFRCCPFILTDPVSTGFFWDGSNYPDYAYPSFSDTWDFYIPYYIGQNYTASPLLTAIRPYSFLPELSSIDYFFGGDYPDISYLYSLAPSGSSSKPIYYNAIQLYAGAQPLGAYNGGVCCGASGFRILSDYTPAPYDTYSFLIYVFYNPGGSSSVYPSQVNFTQGTGGNCRISTSSVSSVVSTLNCRVLSVTVTFDGETKVSDIIFGVGGNATTDAFIICNPPTVVRESFGSFLLYQPGSSLSGSSGDGNMQAIVEAIESADSNNTDAIEQARALLEANANANANRQIQAAESIASQEMSQAESQHEELLHGYEVDSSVSASNEALQSAVDELASIESQIDTQIQDGVTSLESLFEPANWNEVSQGFAVINTFINRLYEGAGIWQIVFQLTLILGLASMLLAGYMFVTGRLHRK